MTNSERTDEIDVKLIVFKQLSNSVYMIGVERRKMVKIRNIHRF